MGEDATEAFYSLHRHEVLERPQYARLVIGTVQGEESVVVSRVKGQLSKVPYAEPGWLSDGFSSPYYKEVRGVCYLYRDEELTRADRAIASYRRQSVNLSMKSSTQMRR